MAIDRRTFIAALGGAPLAGLLPGAAFAAYPDRAIHLIVPFAAGGNADIVGRLIGDVMGKNLKQTVVVENRGGAGGGVGAQAVAKADADGYMLLVASNGPMTINPLMHSNLGYDPQKDFSAVALTSYVPHALILTNKIEAKNIQEFVAASKKTPTTIGTSGVGSATHMTLERLKAATGANITHVPYRGGGALMPDLMAGTISGAMTEFSTALQMHKGGKAHIVGVALIHRSKLAPDIPTFIDGGVKDFTAGSYIGIVAPAKTPPAVIAQLQKAIADGLKPGSPAATRLEELGAEIATPEQMTAAGFAAFLKADAANMKKAADLAGIKPQ